MTFEQYLLKQKISTAAFAKVHGYPFETVRKWRQKIRIPRPETILRLKKLTKGRVNPNDWYTK